MRVREGLSSVTANLGQNNYNLPQGYKVGKVYSVILNEKSVPQQVWDSNGQWGGIGTILYQEYQEGSEISLENLDDNTLNSLPTALPLFPNQKYFPLPGEIVLLMDLPSAPSPISNKEEETYYVSPINAWNSSQFNGLFKDGDKSLLYDSFKENQNFRGLQAFEGDYILEGRFGNSIRFGSTNKSGATDLNPWSTNPEELDSNPITLITNQHNNISNELCIEDLNKDGASIYLTSKQKIPLNIGNIKLSNIVAPTSVNDYSDPQIIVNADRVVLSSKADEVLIFGKTGIEMYSQGPIYLQSNKIGITLQDNNIFLGPTTNSQATQPLILGSDLKIFLSKIVKSLSDFTSTLSDAVSTPQGTPLLQVNVAASALQTAISSYMTQLDDPDFLVSKQVFTT